MQLESEIRLAGLLKVLLWMFLHFRGLRRYPQHWVCCPLLLPLPLVVASVHGEHPCPHQEPHCKAKAGGGEVKPGPAGEDQQRCRHAYSIVQERAKGWSLNTAPQLRGRGRLLIAFFPAAGPRLSGGTFLGASLEHRQLQPRTGGRKGCGLPLYLIQGSEITSLYG